ncbi:MAG: CoA transferase subunit A [Firmicutes bacterium]|nr:CoA transferase subunit A [Bacillota bacterium]MCL5013012.1 CoA transferase subunit A [Bacillota bacterium]
MSKVMTLTHAVKQFVTDGSSLFLGAAHEALIPFAAVHELIRQNKRHLTFCAPISDVACDLLIGAGLLDAVKVAWAGNVSGGLGHNIRRSQEQGIPHPVTFYDYSNYTMALALQAAQMGVPFLPTRTLQGTDLLNSRVGFEPFTWHEESLVAVPALQPDVAIIGVQRADKEGNGVIDGPRGMTHEVMMASRHVILICEELLESSEEKSPAPWQIDVPSLVVDAVVPISFAFHPSPCLGFYGRDTAFFGDYHQQTRSLDGFKRWLDTWIGDSHDDYLAQLGAERLQILRSHEKEGLLQWPKAL